MRYLRSISESWSFLLCFLEFLLQNKAELLTGGDQNRTRIRTLAKYLNMYGGVCLLDCLSQTDIIRILTQEFEKIQEREAKEQPKAEQKDSKKKSSKDESEVLV